MALVPSLLNFVLSRPEFTPENFGHLECVISGAAPVPPSAAVAVLDKIGEHVFVQNGKPTALTEQGTVSYSKW